MKRILLILLMVLLLFGCKKDQEPEENKPKLPEIKEKFNLDSKYYNSTEMKDVTAEELNKMVDNKETFAVFYYSPGCSSCAAFNVVLTDFQKEYKIGFLKIPTEEKKKTIINDYMTYAPSLVIFKEGKIVAFLDAVSDDDMKYYETVDNFKEWFEKYINLEEK